jgi:ATP-dependent Lon protease
MTDEIDLRGNALPIGVLREKTNSISREQLKTVFIPKENNKDISELPNEIISALEIVTVSKLRDMFNKVFLEDITKRKDRIAKITSQMKNI